MLRPHFERTRPVYHQSFIWRLLLLVLCAIVVGGCGDERAQQRVEAERLLEQEKHEQAAALLEQLLQRDPSDQEAHYRLGQAYVAQQRYQEALTEYELALSLNPARQDIQYDIGKVAWKLDRTRAGVQAFLNALQVSATDAQVREMLEITGEIYRARRLTQAEGTSASPAFSPDGQQIAFVRTIGRVNRIWIMDIEGNNATLLTPDGASDASPQFSPDGQHILFSSRPVGDMETSAAVYVMSRNGTKRRLLIQSEQELLNPSFTADGREVIFERNDTGTPEGWEILRFREGVTVQLTQNQFTDVGPKISPDGLQIVFSSTRDGHPDNYEIYLMGADGSQQVALTQDLALDLMPSFSAAGDEIVFVSDRDGNEEIYVMANDGTNLKRLTYSDGKDTTPAFSPDGEWIAFASIRDSDYLQIHVLDRSRELGRADLLARLRQIHKRGW